MLLIGNENPCSEENFDRQNFLTETVQYMSWTMFSNLVLDGYYKQTLYSFGKIWLQCVQISALSWKMKNNANPSNNYKTPDLLTVKETFRLITHHQQMLLIYMLSIGQTISIIIRKLTFWHINTSGMPYIERVVEFFVIITMWKTKKNCNFFGQWLQ